MTVRVGLEAGVSAPLAPGIRESGSLIQVMHGEQDDEGIAEFLHQGTIEFTERQNGQSDCLTAQDDGHDNQKVSVGTLCLLRQDSR